MTRFALALALLFAGNAAPAQDAVPAKSVTVRNLTLVNLTQLPVDDYQQIVRDVQNGQDQVGWPVDIPGLIREALQRRGYFRAQVGEAETTVVSETAIEKVVDLAFRVDAGQIYKLESLQLPGCNFFPPDQLRAQFPISPGELFDVEKVRLGLISLRKLYANSGFINFTPVPNTDVVNQTHRIKLAVSCDEGARFYVGDLKLTGLPPQSQAARTLTADWASLEGKLYNPKETEDFMKRHQELLPSGFRAERNLAIRQDVKSHTVEVELLPYFLNPTS